MNNINNKILSSVINTGDDCSDIAKEIHNPRNALLCDFCGIVVSNVQLLFLAYYRIKYKKISYLFNFKAM